MSKRVRAALCVLLLAQALPAAASAAGGSRALSAPAQERGSVVVRLHIVANSDSADDLAAKIAVRDALWNYMESRLAGQKSARREFAALQAMTPSLTRIARETLRGYGLRYGASVRLGSAILPRRTYLGDTLPGGRYLTLLVVLGEGKGQNWWCLLFPQLCFSDQGASVGYSEQHALLPTGFVALQNNPRPIQVPVVRPGGLLWSFWRRFHPQNGL